MKFEYIFKKSYDEYKKKFKNIFLLSLIFIGIPIIISSLFFLSYIIKNPEFYKAIIIDQKNIFPTNFFVYIFLFGLISFIFFIIFEAGLIKESISGKFNFHKTINSGRNNFWRLIWFFIVVAFFLMLLFLALIIPGIIFAIYWSVAIFVYFDGKKTVIESLRVSFSMIKGNWWKIFGYSLLMVFLYVITSLIFGLISLSTELSIYSLENPSAKLLILNVILNSISNFLYNLIIIPFSILFYKNIYIELKKKK